MFCEITDYRKLLASGLFDKETRVNGIPLGAGAENGIKTLTLSVTVFGRQLSLTLDVRGFGTGYSLE